MKIKAEAIESLPPGTEITINGEVWIRMKDSISNHLEGCLFHPKTGDWGHWSRMVLFSEEVEISNPEEVSSSDRFCDGHCTWRDHHPDCEKGK